jgi:hypothetical protein
MADVYSDSLDGETSRTKVAIERRTVDAGTVVTARLAPSGGHAMRLAPLDSDSPSRA